MRFMKCNLSFKNKISKKDRKDIEKFIYDNSVDYIKQENRNCIRRTFKLMAVSLNEKYGFGKKRLLNLFNGCGAEANARRNQDPIFWAHIDKKVIDELGLEFEKEKYDELDD